MSRTIEIDSMQPGMVLKKSIYNRFGQMILPEGKKLEEKHKRILKTWGVSNISIVDNAEETVNEEWEVDDSIKERASEQLKRRMLWEPRNSNEESMYRVALKRKIAKISRQSDDIT